MSFFDFFRRKKEEKDSGDTSWIGSTGATASIDDSEAEDSHSDVANDTGGSDSGDGGGGSGD